MTTVAGAPVVVGVDGSPRSLTAVATAAAEAAARHRALRILHAYTWPPIGMIAAPGIPGPSLQACRALAESYLQAATEHAAKTAPDVDTTSDTVVGAAAPALVAESRHANLLVLGDHGFGGIAELLVGSTAAQTAAHAACPLLVVRGDRQPDGPVVAGVDGSARSMLALQYAAEQAVRHGTELVALHAWNGKDGTDLDADLPMSYEFWSGDEQERRVLAEAVAGLAARYPDLRIRREVRRGSARRLLTEWSRTAQLVVVGDRGHGGFAGLLLGSVSRYLLYRSACPIAIVRPAPARPTTD